MDAGPRTPRKWVMQAQAIGASDRETSESSASAAGGRDVEVTHVAPR